MATPTASRSNTVSTPKNNLSGTPTRMMASPRPGFSGAGAGGRPLAGKSPAVKTPASGHGHSHNLSSSSHPSLTPLALQNMADDLLALNFPSPALMASLNSHGLTPVSSGQNGLGIPTVQQGGFVTEAAGGRNVEADRLNRLQGLADALKTKIAGPGITREGVERLAQINGFSLLPEAENITIAGNQCVDLEITFDHLDHDLVKGVVLKINIYGEDEHFKTTSEILKNDLTQSLFRAHDAPWKSLGKFATNLSYLSQMDHLSSKVNCFAALGGLHDNFQSIWQEEKKRLTWRNEFQHLARGAVGRPSMDRDGTLGLSIDYWAQDQELQDAVLSENDENGNKNTSENSLDGALPVLSSGPRGEGRVVSNIPSGSLSQPYWRASISCETGSPSITKFRNWLAPEVFSEDQGAKDAMSDKTNTFDLAWRDPLQSDSMTGTKEDQDTMIQNLESLMDTELSNVRFFASLDPPVLLPLNTILGLNGQSLVVDVDQDNVVTYQDRLQKTNKQHGVQATNSGWAPYWARRLTVIDQDGQTKRRKHTYSIHGAGSLWCYPVDKLAFNHPRQLVRALPVLRQYALLWALLEKLVSGAAESATGTNTDGLPAPNQSAKTRTRSNRPQKTSTKAHRPVLNAPVPEQQSSDLEGTLPLSITLDVVTVSVLPTIHIIVPLGRVLGFGKISVGVGLNAKLAVSFISSRPLNRNLDAKMNRVLALSEDLGVLIEWLLEQVQDGQSEK